jgi:hypothetical protein
VCHRWTSVLQCCASHRNGWVASAADWDIGMRRRQDPRGVVGNFSAVSCCLHLLLLASPALVSARMSL